MLPEHNRVRNPPHLRSDLVSQKELILSDLNGVF